MQFDAMTTDERQVVTPMRGSRMRFRLATNAIPKETLPTTDYLLMRAMDKSL
jgi:UTP-glucose-1-phosphate uridylyltransferase